MKTKIKYYGENSWYNKWKGNMILLYGKNSSTLYLVSRIESSPFSDIPAEYGELFSATVVSAPTRPFQMAEEGKTYIIGKDTLTDFMEPAYDVSDVNISGLN